MPCVIISGRGPLKKSGPCVDRPEAGSTPHQRNVQDIGVADVFGIAAGWIEERSAAARGALFTTPVHFQNCQSLPFGGVLLLVPFLLESGLLSFKNHYQEVDPGYYYIDAIVLLLAFMYLCRIKNPEQLKSINPGEFGKLLGLDRIPEAKCLRKKLKAICGQQKAAQWNMELAKTWASGEESGFYYIDGHVQVYHGYQAQLGKKYISRQKLCLPGVQEFWVNNAAGMPYFYVCGQVNEKLQQVIGEQILPGLLAHMPLHQDPTPGTPKLTIVFDREAYSPLFFDQLWNDHQVAVITYRKNVKDLWDTSQFSDHTVEIEGVQTTMKLAEQSVTLDQKTFREIRRLTASGHQTSIVTTHRKLAISQVALYMFSRWSQENFFRYMRQDYDFDKIAQYTVNQIDSELEVVNPTYNKLEHQIKKTREKIARRKAQLYTLAEENLHSDLDQTPKMIQRQLRIEEELAGFQQQQQQLLEQRQQTPRRIKIEDMGQNRYNQLHLESKLFRNIVKMICYRAETSLAALLCADLKKAGNEKRAIAKSLINTPVDLEVDDQKGILQVNLYTQATPRYNKLVEKLCQVLNLNTTKFPGTDLKIHYQTTTKTFTTGQEF